MNRRVIVEPWSLRTNAAGMLNSAAKPFCPFGLHIRLYSGERRALNCMLLLESFRDVGQRVGTIGKHAVARLLSTQNEQGGHIREVKSEHD